MNKQVFIGFVLLGILATAAYADADTPKETVQTYAPRGIAITPWFAPHENGALFLSQNNMGVRLEPRGTWGSIEAQGSPHLVQTMWTDFSVVQYWFPMSRILATGPVESFTPGTLSWASVDYTIPGVYEFDGVTPAKIDEKIIAEVTPKSPELDKWDGRVKADICYGTGKLAIEKPGNDGKWTQYDRSDFCDEAKSSEMAQYRTQFGYPGMN